VRGRHGETLSEFDDSWRDLDYTLRVDQWLARPTDRWGTGEASLDRDGKRGRPMDAGEYAAFQSKGRKVNYCGERLAKQRLNDNRAAMRKDLRPLGLGVDGSSRDLIDLVIDAIAWSTRPAEMLTNSQAVIQQIMSPSRNRKYRPTAGMSKMHKLHQQDIRLVHAVGIKGITQAEYCRCAGLKPYAASRSLARIAKKEPGFLDALNARSACAAMVSWQKVRQSRMLRRRERERKEVKLVYGLNDQTIDMETYPSQASFGRMSLSGGRSQILSPIHEEPAEPDPWFAFEFLGALFGEPPRRIAIRVPAPYRVRRPLSRSLQLKKGGRKIERVARAVPIETWAWPIYQSKAPRWPRADSVFLDRLPAQLKIAIAEDEHDPLVSNRKRKKAMLGLRAPDQPRCLIRTGEIVKRRKRAGNAKPMCIWPRFARLPPVRRPHGLIAPFTKRGWVRWPVKDTETLLATQVPDGPRLYFVRPVNRS
jgi:hypothetical protein